MCKRCSRQRPQPTQRHTEDMSNTVIGWYSEKSLLPPVVMFMLQIKQLVCYNEWKNDNIAYLRSWSRSPFVPEALLYRWMDQKMTKFVVLRRAILLHSLPQLSQMQPSNTCVAQNKWCVYTSLSSRSHYTYCTVFLTAAATRSCKVSSIQSCSLCCFCTGRDHLAVTTTFELGKLCTPQT